MNIYHDLNPARVRPDDFIAVIEIPKNSKVKYELDKETGLITMDRVLHTSTHYPANYGLIPLTYADDDDPLDVLVICSEILHPMSLVRCYPIGVIKMLDNGRADEKIIAVPYGDPTYNGYRSIHTLPKHITDEMHHFFSVYKALEKKETAVDEVMGEEDAKRIIQTCIDNYRTKFGVDLD
ncbi:MAG: inorganic diphosphatase [Oscillospiraceae bacterium]|nr:inorganic diphosphatase [Oscillospiraceae bacterium]